MFRILGEEPHLPPRKKEPIVPARPPPTPDRSSIGSANGIFRTAIGKLLFNITHFHCS